MTKEQILQRIDLLRDAFSWSLEKDRVLTVGMRIYLSQERAALMQCLNELDEHPSKEIAPAYVIPRHLEHKVQHIGRIIAATKWRKKIVNP